MTAGLRARVVQPTLQQLHLIVVGFGAGADTGGDEVGLLLIGGPGVVLFGTRHHGVDGLVAQRGVVARGRRSAAEVHSLAHHALERISSLPAQLAELQLRVVGLVVDGLLVRREGLRDGRLIALIGDGLHARAR